MYGLTDYTTVDSWNNISNYSDIRDSFIIFDEQRAIGNGKWAKTFVKMARNNEWIMLSGTPGDNGQTSTPGGGNGQTGDNGQPGQGGQGQAAAAAAATGDNRLPLTGASMTGIVLAVAAIALGGGFILVRRRMAS